MKKIIVSIVLLVLSQSAQTQAQAPAQASTTAQAQTKTKAQTKTQTVYVTDYFKFTLRVEPLKTAKILKMLPSGVALTLLQTDKDSGYSKVRTATGTEGYVLTRHTLDAPTNRQQLSKKNKQFEKLEQKFNTAKKQLALLKKSQGDALASGKSAAQERDALSRELNDLRQTAASAIQIKEQRDKLRERIIFVERELQQAQHKNKVLESSANQDWFLYGGILALAGIILGFMLPKLGWRRRGSWDTL